MRVNCMHVNILEVFIVFNLEVTQKLVYAYNMNGIVM